MLKEIDETRLVSVLSEKTRQINGCQVGYLTRPQFFACIGQASGLSRFVEDVIEQTDVVHPFPVEIEKAKLQITVSLRILAVVSEKALVSLKRNFVVANDDAIERFTVLHYSSLVYEF
jgi:hypothetical protein